jgi:hypothetical protein
MQVFDLVSFHGPPVVSLDLESSDMKSPSLPLFTITTAFHLISNQPSISSLMVISDKGC